MCFTVGEAPLVFYLSRCVKYMNGTMATDANNTKTTTALADGRTDTKKTTRTDNMVNENKDRQTANKRQQDMTMMQKNETATVKEDDDRGHKQKANAENFKITELTYEKEMTMQLELNGDKQITAIDLIRCTRLMCGGIFACRSVGNNRYEITMSGQAGKNKLSDGFKIGNTMVQGKAISNDEMVVSFLGLSAYIIDGEILEKLESWGVSAVSPIKCCMWQGTWVADGTRFVNVRFTVTVQSLPYSAKFNTATGIEHFRVIHNRQMKVCRVCIQPGHILRDCPEFMCFKCGVQGHCARECMMKIKRCAVCYNLEDKCICNDTISDIET